MKSFLFFLDKPLDDGIMDSINKEPIVKKYWFQLGFSIMALLITIVLGVFSFLKYEYQDAPETHAVNLEKKTSERLVVLPYPHQSFANVGSWALEAITSAYSFDFNDYDKQVNRAAYYFTAEGYSQYLNALTLNGIRESVIGKKLQISIVPLQDPVFVNMGSFGNTEFWRIRVPTLTSYFGGKDPVIQKMLVEVLVLRVPAYKNHKGLAIAEFNMTPM